MQPAEHKRQDQCFSYYFILGALNSGLISAKFSGQFPRRPDRSIDLNKIIPQSEFFQYYNNNPRLNPHTHTHTLPLLNDAIILFKFLVTRYITVRIYFKGSMNLFGL